MKIFHTLIVAVLMALGGMANAAPKQQPQPQATAQAQQGQQAEATPATVNVPATKASGSRNSVKLAPNQKVNLNTANAQELELLPGVGPTLAQAILTYRQANGPFKAPEDIMKVSGIRQGRFATIAPWIIVDDRKSQSGKDKGVETRQQ